MGPIKAESTLILEVRGNKLITGTLVLAFTTFVVLGLFAFPLIPSSQGILMRLGAFRVVWPQSILVFLNTATKMNLLTGKLT